MSAGIFPSLVTRGSAIDAFRRSCAARSSFCVSLDQRLGLRRGQDALLDELRCVQLAGGRLRGDLGDHQRLGVRGLVLLVVPEAPVADEVDDDVVTELLPVRESKPDGSDRGLGIVCVDVDDRDVEALREVARVAGRATLVRVRGEADLVVRDQVESAAGRVAVEAREVERLGDDTLAGERRVAVDQDRQRDGRVVDAAAGRAVGLLGSCPALDDRVDRLEVAGVRSKRDRDLARPGRARAGRREVVLDVAGASFVVRDDRVDRPLALELAENRLVGEADRVHEHVQAAAVRHADHDLVRSRAGGDLHRLVEHRHHRVQALDRELLLAEERAAEVLLEPLDASERLQQADALIGLQRLPVAARLDRLPEPDPLGVIRKVLDLVGHRAGVDLAQRRERFLQRLAGDVHAQQLCRDPRLQLRRQRRDQARLVERGIAERLGAERVEARRQMAVHPVCLDESHCGSDAAEQGLVDRGRRCDCRALGLRSGLGGRCSRRCRSGGRRWGRRMPVAALE